MPRRAAISFLILLLGTAGAMAGTMDPSVRNQQFQPGTPKAATILHPAQVRYASGRTPKLSLLHSLVPRAKVSHGSVLAARDAKASLPVVKAGGN